MPLALLVESDSRDALTLQKLLMSESIESLVLESAEAAEREIANTARRYDVAFLTWNVSNLLLTQCRHTRPAMPVVVVSGSLDLSVACVATALGAKKFLEKPIDPAELSECVRSLLAAHDPLSARVIHLRAAELGNDRKHLVGDSPEFVDMLRKLAMLLDDDKSAVLITGESGTGKELIALALHQLGKRASKPWLAVNVAAIAPTLIESELFGHEKNSFTGATDRRLGLLEEAADGTLFLDEIGELQLDLQAKLLRVIQERIFRRVGGSTDLPLLARLVFATDRKLADEVNAGHFRSALFHRITQRQIHVPALRERTGDLEILIQYFCRRYGNGKPIVVARTSINLLRQYAFPGNVRQLETLIEAALSGGTQTIYPEHLNLKMMGDLSKPDLPAPGGPTGTATAPAPDRSTDLHLCLPPECMDLPLDEAHKSVAQAFDRMYLPRMMKRAGYRWAVAARNCETTEKTLKSHWDECGLEPLNPRRPRRDVP